MLKKIFIVVAVLSPGYASFAAMEDDPLLSKVMLEQLEVRSLPGPDAKVLDAEAWVGRDLDKLWLKAEVERIDSSRQEIEAELLYSRAVAPYWDFQAGWRHDFRPEPERNWFVIGFKGLAPYWFEIDTSLFIRHDDEVGARLEAEYEWMLTQKWVLSPEFELNVFHQTVDEGDSAWLYGFDLGLRLRYELRREFAPYIGVNWTKLYGRAAELAREENEPDDDLQVVGGVRLWF